MTTPTTTYLRSDKRPPLKGGRVNWSVSQSSEWTLSAMRPESRLYTLVGFSVELDWRPMRFVQPIPEYRVCGACGLVRKKTASLPCKHTLCQSCYELSSQDGIRVCPLDARCCKEEDVYLKEFSAEDMLRREVKCWNEEQGCRVVLPASKISQHFHRECAHHSICCPRCPATVLCSDVCAHLRSKSCAKMTRRASRCEYPNGCTNGVARQTALREPLGGQAGDLKSLVERLLAATVANSERLSEVVRSVNHEQEALRQELFQCINSLKQLVREEVDEGKAELRDYVKNCLHKAAAFSDESRERVSSNCGSIGMTSDTMRTFEAVLQDELLKAVRESLNKFSQLADSSEKAKEGNQEKEMTISPIDKLSQHPALQVRHYEFIVKGVKSLEDTMWQRGRAEHKAERVYLRGYSVTPVVHFDVSHNGTVVRPQLRLHQGDHDDILEWPLKQTVKVHFVHPKEDTENAPKVLDIDINNSARPAQTGSLRWNSDSGHYLCDLFESGFVENDQLKLRFEVVD